MIINHSSGWAWKESVVTYFKAIPQNFKKQKPVGRDNPPMGRESNLEPLAK